MTKFIPYLVFFINAESHNNHAIRNDDDTKEIIEKNLPPPSEVKRFRMPQKKYPLTYQGLKSYLISFKGWCSELESEKISYRAYYTDSTAILKNFEKLCKGKYEHFEIIKPFEIVWMNQCNNGGLIYCKPGTYQSYGYDFKSCYPRVMGTPGFQIPTKEGKEIILDTLPQKLQYGIYRCKVLCEDDDIRKIFSFSPKNCYTHYSLNLIRQKDIQRRFKIHIELIQDGKPNAIVFDSLIESVKVFEGWFKRLMEVREKFPKNHLAKELLTGLWGRLCEQKKITKTVEQIENENIDVGILPKDPEMAKAFKHQYYYGNLIINDDNTHEYYELHEFKQNLQFRIKPFIVSFVRSIMGTIAFKYIENVIRVQTDNITFDSDVLKELNIPNFLPEQKTTGLITWKNANVGVKENEKHDEDSDEYYL